MTTNKMLMNPLLASTLITLVSAPTARGQDYPYAIIDLGDLGHPNSTTPRSINGTGQVAGTSGYNQFNDPHTFLWHNGSMRDLGTIGSCCSFGSAINDLSQVAGTSTTINSTVRHAAIWYPDGSILDLGTLGGDDSDAFAINNLGQAAGYAAYEVTSFYRRAFFWDGGAMIDLGTFGGLRSIAWGLNDLGQVVGEAEELNRDDRAFVWENGILTQLPDLGGDRSQATDINNFGQAVGNSNTPPSNSSPEAVLWENGQVFRLFDPSVFDASGIHAINNVGQVAGNVILNNGDVRSYIYDLLTGEYMLLEDHLPPHHRWTVDYLDIQDLNDFGQVVGLMPIGVSDHRGFVITPVHPEMTMSGPNPGIAGRANTLTATNCIPGARIYFVYGTVGGGYLIPGCDLQDAVLQIDIPIVAGTATADANGVATLTAFVPNAARNIGDILLQAVEVSNCKQSQLIVARFQ